MKKEEIMNILDEWNLWHKDLNTGVRRETYVERLKKSLQTDEILVITGPRRSGKSFIMRQLAADLVQSGVEKNRILFVNFEDPRFSVLDAGFLQDIFEAYREFLRPAGVPYIFLDEVQEVDQWEKWVRTKHELGAAKLIISGSNAKLLSRELATVLTGRHLDVKVWPLSFTEFLQFSKVETTTTWRSAKQIEIQGRLREYLATGGFPEVVKRENKKEILLTYFEDIVEKDLVRRYRVRKADKIKELARYYFSNVSKLSTDTAAGKIVAVSPDTVKKFARYLENSYLLYFLKRFSFKVKEQEKSPRKVYAVDPGLARAVGFEFSDNLGRHMENVVFLELMRQASRNPFLSLYYWKDAQHREVDFVVKEKNQISHLLQVVWDLSDERVKDRERKNLLLAMKALGQHAGTIITLDYTGEEKNGADVITYIPLGEWLLR